MEVAILIVMEWGVDRPVINIAPRRENVNAANIPLCTCKVTQRHFGKHSLRV